MLISDEKRFLFIHIPKTGGTSMAAALRPWSTRTQWCRSRTKHDTWRSFRDQNRTNLNARGLRGDTMDGWFRFAFVRNPWDRFLSLHAYLTRHPPGRVPEIDDMRDFQEFVTAAQERRPWLMARHSMKEQVEFICDDQGVSQMDFVGRFEHLATDAQIVFTRLGVDAHLPHENASERPSYPAAFDDRARAVVEDLFARDIAAFGYRF